MINTSNIKKKILMLVLALAMVFGLCACATPNTDISNIGNMSIVSIEQSIQDAKEKLAKDENCHLVLRITINPQLELYLDETGTVLKVEAGNKDGESLLAALDLLGLSYEDAMSSILSTAKSQNFLPENATVQVDVLASSQGPLSQAQTKLLAQVILDYNAQLIPSVNQNVVHAANCDANLVKVENLQDGGIFYSYYSNQVLVLEICYDADGSYTEWAYENGEMKYVLIVDPDGTCTKECKYKDDGKTVHEVTVQKDGQTIQAEQTYYDEDGVRLYSVVSNTDETCEIYYYANGKPQLTKSAFSDGSTAEQSFYENGNLQADKMIWSDGSFSETYYYENEVMQSYKMVWSDGSFSERYYHENGNPQSVKEVASDGSYFEQFYAYYDNGNLWSVNEIRSDGSTREESYYEDGSKQSSKHVGSDGSSSEQSFYTNGNQQSHKRIGSDGSISEYHYFSDGKLKTGSETFPNGDSQYATYEKDGSFSIVYTKKDGTTEQTKFNADGQRTYRHTTFTSGEWVECTFYANDNVKTMVRFVNGKRETFLYDEDGKQISP